MFSVKLNKFTIIKNQEYFFLIIKVNIILLIIKTFYTIAIF